MHAKDVRLGARSKGPVSLSLSLLHALSWDIGSQDPYSARSVAATLYAALLVSQMVAVWLGPSSPPHSCSPSSWMDSGPLLCATKKKILCATSDHKNNSFFPPPWAAYWGCSISTELLLAFSLKTLHLPATPLASSCPPLPIISKLVAPRQRSPPQFLNFSSLDQVGI